MRTHAVFAKQPSTHVQHKRKAESQALPQPVSKKLQEYIRRNLIVQQASGVCIDNARSLKKREGDAANIQQHDFSKKPRTMHGHHEGNLGTGGDVPFGFASGSGRGWGNNIPTSEVAWGKSITFPPQIKRPIQRETT